MVSIAVTTTLLWPLGLCDTDNLEEGLHGSLCYIVPLSQIILIHVYCALFLHVLCLIPKHSCMYTFSVYLHQLITWGGEGQNLVHTYVYTDAESYRLQAYMWEGLCVCLRVSSTAGGVPG